MHSIPFSYPGPTPQTHLHHPPPSSQPLPNTTSPAIRPTPPLQHLASFPGNSGFLMYVPATFPTEESADEFRWQQQNGERNGSSVSYSPYPLPNQFSRPPHQHPPPTSPTTQTQQSTSSSSSATSSYPPSQSPQRQPQPQQLLQPYQHHEQQQKLLAKAATEVLRQQPALHAQSSSGPSPKPPIALSGIYSSTGFDMLSILAKIACRPNPTITIGPVDFSCSFLVVDAKTPANPIVYASDTFEKLTGYTNAEIIGRNCRFLQSPDGLVDPWSLRKYTDNSVVKQIKQSLDGLQECQFTLINYKKGGVPFINLLTIIPISWDNPKEISLFVGFQVDLVDQPQAILNRMKDGQYVVNYQIAQNIQQHTIRDEDGQADELSELFSLHTSTSASPANKHVPEMLHTIVDTFADFLFILSLRGLFLYASYSSTRRLMEYKQEELLGHKLAEFVHPADLVAVMRELRNSAPGGRINVVCRFRRKHSGYVYMEVTGHVYEGETGKRTKCFVLSGRERSVGSLPLRDVLPPEIEAGRETWAKVTYEGLFLFACSNASAVLGYGPAELFARSLVEIVHEKDRGVVNDTLRSIKGLVTQPFPSPPLSVVQAPASGTPTTVTTDGADSATSVSPPSEKRGVYRDVRVRIVCPRQQQLFAPVHIRVYSDGDRFTRYLFLQIKLIQPAANGALQFGQVSTTTSSSADYAARMGIWNGSPRGGGSGGVGGDLLDVMSSTRATSLHYELNQLRMANKRLREELESLEYGGKKRMTASKCE
ncbi:hypothetical protein BJ742DRAFT_871595 [Cladochytrium replicatum]|nr:hypothetical protein BJ742DRAFT_871595 [Cladochytrium replicatum]